LQRKIWDDIGTAVLALVLAIIVWVNATYQADRPREDMFGTAVPIEVLGAPVGLVATNNPTTEVQIKIKAFSSSWDVLSVTDFSVTADWTGLEPGMHAVPVNATCSDRTTTIIDVHPSTVYVRLEEVKKEPKEVAVELLNRDNVPIGYRVYAPIIEPALVTVDGPASAVDRVANLRVSLSLLGQSTSIDRVVEPVPIDDQGQLVTGVTLSPKEVRVQVTVEKKQNYREVVVRARTVGQPAKGYFVIGVDVVPASITVVGPPTVIDAMGGLVDTMSEIDITGATRLTAARMELDLPEGVTVLGAQEGQVYTVLVTVGVDAVTGGTTVELPLTIRKVQEGLVPKLSVPAVDVILTGPSVLLDELQTDLLEAYVDLTGLGEGVHQVKPAVDIVAAQDSDLRNLVVKDISPKLIEVTLSKLPTATPIPTNTPTSTSTLVPTPVITSTATMTATMTSEPGVASSGTAGESETATPFLVQTSPLLSETSVPTTPIAITPRSTAQKATATATVGQ